MNWQKAIVASAFVAAAITSGGCETKAGTGAIIGGLGGAGIGAIIGHNTGSGHAAGGALIGGAVGAIGGAVVGNEMDKKDRQDAYTRNYDENFDAYGNRR